jgi:hypothetical protein
MRASCSNISQMRPGTPEFRNAQQYFGLGGRFNPAAWQAFMIAGPYSTNVEDRRDEPPPPMEEVVAAWKNWDNKWKDTGATPSPPPPPAPPSGLTARQ